MVALFGLALFIQLVALEQVALLRQSRGALGRSFCNPVALPTPFSRRGQPSSFSRSEHSCSAKELATCVQFAGDPCQVASISCHFAKVRNVQVSCK